MIWTAFFFSVVAIIFTACVVTAYMDRFERAYMFQDKEKEKKARENRLFSVIKLHAYMGFILTSQASKGTFSLEFEPPFHY